MIFVFEEKKHKKKNKMGKNKSSSSSSGRSSRPSAPQSQQSLEAEPKFLELSDVEDDPLLDVVGKIVHLADPQAVTEGCLQGLPYPI